MLLFLFVLTLTTDVEQQKTCYYPNGDVAKGDFLCSNSSAVSTCCGKEWDCDDNRLCSYKGYSLSRGSCTDQSWQSSDCPLFCDGK